MARITHLLFDLDGTLVNTHKANFTAYKVALEAHGVHLNWMDFAKTIGMQSKSFLPLLAPDVSPESYATIRQHKAEHYKTQLHETIPNIPLIEFMKAASKSHGIGLVTTAQKESAIAVLKTHNIYDCFNTIVTANDVKAHKPNPEGYLLAMQRLGARPEDTLAFEDSDTGITAAERAGLKVIHVTEFNNEFA